MDISQKLFGIVCPEAGQAVAQVPIWTVLVGEHNNRAPGEDPRAANKLPFNDWSIH